MAAWQHGSIGVSHQFDPGSSSGNIPAVTRAHLPTHLLLPSQKKERTQHAPHPNVSDIESQKFRSFPHFRCVSPHRNGQFSLYCTLFFRNSPSPFPSLPSSPCPPFFHPASLLSLSCSSCPAPYPSCLPSLPDSISPSLSPGFASAPACSPARSAASRRSPFPPSAPTRPPA